MLFRSLGSNSSVKNFKLTKGTIVGTLVPLVGSENSLMTSLVASTNTSADCEDGSYDSVVINSTTGSGSGAKASIIVSGNVVVSITVTTYGDNYSVGDMLSINAGVLGLGSSRRDILLTLNNIDADIITPGTIGKFFNAPSMSDASKNTLMEEYNQAVFNYNYTLWIRDSLTPIYDSSMGGYWKLSDRLTNYNSNHNNMFPNDYKSYIKSFVGYNGTGESAISAATTFIAPDS